MKEITNISVNSNLNVPLGQAVTPLSATVLTTDYVSNLVYEDGDLKYILNPEGYAVRRSTGDYSYNYYLKDHLGNNRVVLEIDRVNSLVNQATDYYPFGMPYANSQYPERQPYKFGGKEYDEMHGLNRYDFHARHLGTAVPIFTTPDPLAEKYYSVSPYAYCLNNPVRFVDPDGREVSFSYEWEKDEDGNYVKNENGGYNLIGITMNVTGKVINVSSNSKVDMKDATERISNQIESSFSKDVDGVKFSTNVNLSIANSMNDVSDNDHVFALADISQSGVYGASNQLGGKVAFVDADYFTGWYDTNFGNQGPRTAVHEFGHLLNLEHLPEARNLMSQGFSGTEVYGSQFRDVLKSNLNQGVNYELIPINNNGKTVYKKMPNRGLSTPYVNYKKK